MATSVWPTICMPPEERLRGELQSSMQAHSNVRAGGDEAVAMSLHAAIQEVVEVLRGELQGAMQALRRSTQY